MSNCSIYQHNIYNLLNNKRDITESPEIAHLRTNHELSYFAKKSFTALVMPSAYKSKSFNRSTAGPE